MSIARGSIVHYRLTADDAARINRRRTTGGSIAERIADESWRHWPKGAQAHIGNSVGEGEVVPAIVTQVRPEEYAGHARLAHHPEGTTYESREGVNAQVFLDGSDVLWVASAPQHPTLTGCWFWPPRT